MALVRVRRAAQLTLPAEVRQALKVEEGDYLEAEIVEGGVLLKPVAVVARDQERKQAWKRIQASPPGSSTARPMPTRTSRPRRSGLPER